MFKLNYLTHDNSSPVGKSKVYFTCNAEDFDKSFEKISNDILEAFDCAIYFVNDLGARSMKDNVDELDTFNLFVVPVTLNLLTKLDTETWSDIDFAKANRIPILPIMLERGLDPIYSRPELFGEIQYLNPNREDSTQITYNEKLENYLSVALLSPEQIKLACEAVKKDTPSPDDKYLSGLAYFGGAGVEIDRARGINLMAGAANDGSIGACDTLYELYSWGMYVDTDSDAALNYAKQLVELRIEAYGEKSESVIEAKYKLSDAYLGVHDVKMAVETCWRNTEGLKSVLSPTHPLTRKAFLQFASLSHFATNPEVAVRMHSDIARYYLTTEGAEDVDKLVAVTNLAFAYREMGDFETALTLLTDAHNDFKEILGEEHPTTLACLGNVASIKFQAEQYEESLAISEPLYELKRKVLGEAHPQALDALHELGMLYSNLGNHEKAYQTYNQVIRITEKAFGRYHPDMLATLENRFAVSVELGDSEETLCALTDIHECQKIIYGEYSLENLDLAQTIAGVLTKNKRYSEAILWLDKVYKTTSDKPAYAEQAEDTMAKIVNCIHRLNDSSLEAFEAGDFTRALTIQQQVYGFRNEYLGDTHADTLISLNDIAIMEYKCGDIELALHGFECLYQKQCEVYGETSSDVMTTIDNIIGIGSNNHEYRTTVEYLAKKYDILCKTKCEESMEAFDTVDMLCNVCIMLLNENDLSVFTNQFLAECDGKILEILDSIAGMMLAMDEPRTARRAYNILYRYYSEIEGADSQNAREIKAKLDDITD